MRLQFLVDAAQRPGVCERFEQLVMTGARLMRAGEDRIHYAESAPGSDSLGGYPFARAHGSAEHCCRMFESPDDSGADRNNSAVSRFRFFDRPGCGRRDAIWLVEGKKSIQLRIAR